MKISNNFNLKTQLVKKAPIANSISNGVNLQTLSQDTFTPSFKGKHKGDKNQNNPFFPHSFKSSLFHKTSKEKNPETTMNEIRKGEDKNWEKEQLLNLPYVPDTVKNFNKGKHSDSNEYIDDDFLAEYFDPKEIEELDKIIDETVILEKTNELLFSNDEGSKKIALSMQADPLVINSNNQTPIFKVKDAENAQNMINLASDSGVSPKKYVNRIDLFGNNPLHTTVDPDVAKILIKNGADILRYNNNRKLPSEAVERKFKARASRYNDEQKQKLKETIGVLLAEEIRQSTKTLPNKGLIALNKIAYEGGVNFLVSAGEKDAIKMLIDSGAIINSTRKYQMPPITECKTPDMAEFMIENDADIYADCGHGKNVLFETTDPEIAKVFLKQAEQDGKLEKFVNKKTKTYGVTPLHFAKNGKIADLLLSYGADPRAKSYTEQGSITPLDVAYKHNRLDVAEVLNDYEKGQIQYSKKIMEKFGVKPTF